MKEAISFRDGRTKTVAVIRNDVILLFFVVLSFALMVVVSYYFVSGVAEKQIFANVQESLNTAEVTIRSDLREAEVALLQVEMLIENWLKWGESHDEIKAYMTLLADSIMVERSWVQGFMNVYGVINGYFLTSLYDAPPEGYIIEERPWYKTAQAANGRIGLSSPYSHWLSEKTVISLAKTMNDAYGNQYGVLVLDIDFSILSSYVVQLNSSLGGYGMLCDENFVFLSHKFKNNIGKNLADVHLGYAETAKKFMENPDVVFSQRMEDANNVSVVVISRRLYNGWYLGIATPVRSYYYDVNFMAIILSILGFIFMIILSLIIIRLSLLRARSDEQNQGKSSFLARMSHEIRTPMNSILGMAELIRRKAASREYQEYIEIIQQSGANLMAIINDILDFSKIESGRLQIQNREYHIASVINDMVNMMRPRMAEKSLDFFVDVDCNIPAQLYGDDLRLRQILTNILSNAVKYTKKGFVSFGMRMECKDDHTIELVCSITDSGVGIKQEDQERIFNEFVRIDYQVNQGIEGTGLGLVITAALCRAMGGDVTVSSEYGKGSTFTATITQGIVNNVPVAAVDKPENKKVLFYDWRLQYMQSISNALAGLGVCFKCCQEFREFIHDLEYGEFDYAFVTSKYAMDCIFALGRRTTPLQLVIMAEPGEMSVYQEVMSIMMPVYSIPLANALNNESDANIFQEKNMRIKFTAPSAKVLIVDDISTNLRVAKELMSPYEMTIHTCLSGSEALTLVEENMYDIIFMDHMMPGMDGIEATSFIRNLETGDGYYKNLPIIAFTANAVSGQREIFLENGINDFLAKPIDIQKLDDILELWLPKEKLAGISHSSHEEAKAEKPELPVIDGLNTGAGLKNCNGAVPVYLSILEDFCNDTETRLNEISVAFANKDTRLYTTLVHAIKGAAASVGAVETGEDALWLETTAAAGDFEVVKDKNTAFLEKTHAFVNKIRAVLERYEAKSGSEHIDITDLNLDNLKKALSEMDIKAVNSILLEYTSLPLHGKIKDILSEVEQLILMFEYDKAIEKIDELY